MKLSFSSWIAWLSFRMGLGGACFGSGAFSPARSRSTCQRKLCMLLPKSGGLLAQCKARIYEEAAASAADA